MVDEDEGSHVQMWANRFANSYRRTGLQPGVRENRKVSGSPPGRLQPDLFPSKESLSQCCAGNHADK